MVACHRAGACQDRCGSGQARGRRDPAWAATSPPSGRGPDATIEEIQRHCAGALIIPAASKTGTSAEGTAPPPEQAIRTLREKAESLGAPDWSPLIERVQRVGLANRQGTGRGILRACDKLANRS